jgi:hypothetical protein
MNDGALRAVKKLYIRLCAVRDNVHALATLLECVKEVPLVRRYVTSRENRETTGSTTFEFLWTFFPPGSLVVAAVSDHDQLMKVEACKPAQHGDDESQDVFCSMYDWVQNTLKKVTYKMSIPRYAGKRQLEGFPCCPLKYHPTKVEESEILDRLLERGERFWEICKRSRSEGGLHYLYDGPAWMLEQNLAVSCLKGSDKSLTLACREGICLT